MSGRQRARLGECVKAQKKGTPGAKTRRRHGYRGYGSGFDRGFGGTVHWGSGFSGIGSPGESGAMTLAHARMFEGVTGPYAGRAPQGYARSDERIREEICDELTRRPDLDPSWLTVSVTDGGVRLEGAVENLQSRGLADEIATRCIGVREVHNVLRVPSGGGKKALNELQRGAALIGPEVRQGSLALFLFGSWSRSR